MDGQPVRISIDGQTRHVQFDQRRDLARSAAGIHQPTALDQPKAAAMTVDCNHQRVPNRSGALKMRQGRMDELVQRGVGEGESDIGVE